ncbi:hypothetical protein PRECH8_13070 [Insulibacter thermoxylanivorax]|uniref:Uncharacterized protein n=2 Tax=Insulibacter thermoxylanivorax TaxID=2749268 RepID=A0A916QGC3_9BACL|nr:hypothetical protein PRECH8_13070 [Insulibacter thermoxylanivorax]
MQVNNPNADNDSGEGVIEASEPRGPELAAHVPLQRLDGTTAEAPAQVIVNEAIGYYIYILPGYRSEVNPDTGTLTLQTADGSGQAVIEALPVQADLQQAADELQSLLQRIDENMLQITEYKKFSFWEDAYIYRAYRAGERLTAILKEIHGIPLRISVSEPPEVSALNTIMAMISTIHTEDYDKLLAIDERAAQERILQAVQLQKTIIEQFSDDESEAEERNAGNTESLPPADSGPAILTLSELITRDDELTAYMETVYTPDAARTAVQLLGIRNTAEGIQAAAPAQEAVSLIWEEAEINLISGSDTDKRYLVRVPVDAEGTSLLREIEFRKLNAGWRIHTPLDLHTVLPPAESTAAAR